MIKFILENIESSHISSKYIDDFINSKIPDKILNGFLLLGHWAVTYPVKYIYTRILDVLFIFNKNIDLRSILTKEENIFKFFKAIYLLFKAFPKLNEELLLFTNNIKNNLNYWITDYTLNLTAKKMMDRLMNFIDKIMINSDYRNKNTLIINLTN